MGCIALVRCVLEFTLWYGCGGVVSVCRLRHYNYVLCALCVISTYSKEENLYFLHSSHTLHMNVVSDNGMVTFTRTMQFGLFRTGQRGTGGEYSRGRGRKALSTIIPTISYDFMGWSEHRYV